MAWNELYGKEAAHEKGVPGVPGQYPAALSAPSALMIMVATSLRQSRVVERRSMLYSLRERAGWGQTQALLRAQRKKICIEQAFGWTAQEAQDMDRCMAGKVYCFVYGAMRPESRAEIEIRP